MAKKIFHEQAWDDYLFWQSHHKATLKRINILIRDIERGPYQGIGKPEPLKHDLSGWWSRRINEKDRIVYRVEGDEILFASMRFHYQ